MYKFSKEFYIRVGSGLGYKLPTIFSTETEEAAINNIQPLSKNIKAEKSVETWILITRKDWTMKVP